MAQIKIYGERKNLRRIREQLSAIIHEVAQEVLGLPENKRFHRFIPLDGEDFIYPADRSAAYIIIEISMFEGRSTATKRRLLESLMQNIAEGLHLDPTDVEITLFETPRSHWGIRGQTGDALTLGYKVES
ncbi:MAG: tautomerase family protein [Geminicoccaceae bacterium]